MKKTLKYIGLIWVVLGLGFFVYMYFSFSAQGFDKDSIHNDSTVLYHENEEVIRFSTTSDKKIEVFFLQGALVDPQAYEPLGYHLAQLGYNFNIVKMPWRMADRGYEKIASMDSYKNDDCKIVIMGHSKGGKMAAQFVKEFSNQPDALILLGTTHPRDIDLSTSQIPILKISGSKDKVAPVSTSAANASKLPSNAQFEIIKGGNHSQFGYYGDPFGDGEATITHEDQLQEMVNFIDDFLRTTLLTDSNN